MTHEPNPITLKSDAAVLGKDIQSWVPLPMLRWWMATNEAPTAVLQRLEREAYTGAERWITVPTVVGATEDHIND